MKIRTSLAAGSAAAVLLLAPACSSDDDSSTSTGDTTTSNEAAVEVTDAWSRPSPMVTGAAAVYLDLTASADDALVGASVDPSIAAAAEIHETTMAGDDMDTDDDMDMDGDSESMDMDDDAMSNLAAGTDDGDSMEMDDAESMDMEDDGDDSGSMDMDDDMDGGGAMTMQQVESIPLPAGETVRLEPGGYHIMLLELVEPLEEGQTFEVTLEFESAATQTVTVTVQDA